MPSQEFSGYSQLKIRKERKVADALRVVFITPFIDSFNLNFSKIYCTHFATLIVQGLDPPTHNRPFDDKRHKVGMDVVPNPNNPTDLL